MAEIYRLEPGLLSRWQKEGIDIFDARRVALRAISSRTPAKGWVEVKDELFSDDEQSHEFWKREKTKEEVEGLRLKNAKIAGEMFDKGDGDKVQDAWATALQLALAERKATYPQLMAGKDEAWIADFVEGEDRELLVKLADLESGLWQQVFEKYAGLEGPSPDEAKGGKNPSTRKTKRE